MSERAGECECEMGFALAQQKVRAQFGILW